ncbi:MAG: hypothetical protein K2I96_18770 [Lachnospiraceae bacterium]|nr:hypothetical protein [Lachnospiraceae bacterium]
MEHKSIITIVFYILILLLTGCGGSDEEILSTNVELDLTVKSESEEIPSTNVELDLTVKFESEELLDEFLAGKIPAVYDVDDESAIMFDDLTFGEEDWCSYSVGERVDLDNDGESEQIIKGPYGGMYLDARNGKVYVLAEGDGTSQTLSHANYDNAAWIVYSDTTHAGRQMYWLTRYDGDGNVVDEFQLSAEYWDSPDSRYDENSDFTYRDNKISMEEYEALRKEIFGW